MARGAEVRNLQATLRELRKFNPELLKELRKDLTKQAQPVFAAAASKMPDVAAPNWGKRGRTGYSRQRAIAGMKVSARASKRVKEIKGSMAVVNLTQTNAGGAIWDQAGSRGKYSPPVQRGEAFVRQLDRSSGKAQRGLWPATVARRRTIVRDFESSIRETERQVNRRLARR